MGAGCGATASLPERGRLRATASLPERGDADPQIPAQPAHLPDPLIPTRAIAALMALAHAGVGPAGLRAVAIGHLHLSARQIDCFIDMRRDRLAAAAAFAMRGA